MLNRPLYDKDFMSNHFCVVLVKIQHSPKQHFGKMLLLCFLCVVFSYKSPGFGFCLFYLTNITFIDVNGIAESLESTVITDHISDQTTEIIPDLKVFVLLCLPNLLFYSCPSFLLFHFRFSFFINKSTNIFTFF